MFESKVDDWLEMQNQRNIQFIEAKKHLEEVRSEIELIIPEEKILSKMFIAGGAIRSLMTQTKVSDYDIFVKDDETIQEVIDALVYRQTLYQSKNSIGVISSTGKHLQFIVCASGTPESVVGEFDFTCNQSYYDFSTKTLTVHPDAYTMQLRVNSNARNAIGTFLRIGKFLQKGYSYPPREDMIHLGVKMTQHEPITTYTELDESSRMNFTEAEVAQVSEIINMDTRPSKLSASRVGSAGGA
jgi:hypothetical protein